MSPFSNNYSSLEEAWGLDNFPSGYPSTKKSNKKPKKNRDPACELYELGGSPSRAYNDMDVMNVVAPPSRAREVPENFDESPAPPKPPSNPLPIDEDDDDMSEFIGYVDKKVDMQRTKAADVVLPYADIGLYLISGIILIFMMEQFIKIGMMMRS